MKLYTLATALLLAACAAGCSGSEGTKSSSASVSTSDATSSTDRRTALISEIEALAEACPIDLDGVILESAAVADNTACYTYRISDLDAETIKSDIPGTRSQAIKGLKEEGIIQEFVDAGMNLTYKYLTPGGETIEIAITADQLRQAI